VTVRLVKNRCWNADPALTRPRRSLAELRAIPKVKEIRDQAQAVAHYLKQRDGSFQAQQDAAEIKLRAERRLGELLTAEGERRGPPDRSHMMKLQCAAGPRRCRNGVDKDGVSIDSNA